MIYSQTENVKNEGVILSGVYIPVSRLRGTLIEFAYSGKDTSYKRFHCYFPISNNSSVCTRILPMPTTRKQKKVRKSRGLEMLSDIKKTLT